LSGGKSAVSRGFNVMSIWLKAAGKWGSILVILTLIITLLKQVIAFIGFLTAAIKIIVILAFVILFIGVGMIVLRSWNNSRKARE
jgi:L-asparagine transporter-like permease